MSSLISIDPQTVKLFTYGVVAVFLLLQWFMSVRPWFIWGLILPLLFGAAWYCVVKQPLFFDELGFTPDAVEMMSHYCKIGVIASLAVFAVCRLFRLLRRRQEEEYLSATQVAAGAGALTVEQVRQAAAEAEKQDEG